MPLNYSAAPGLPHPPTPQCRPASAVPFGGACPLSRSLRVPNKGRQGQMLVSVDPAPSGGRAPHAASVRCFTLNSPTDTPRPGLKRRWLIREAGAMCGRARGRQSSRGPPPGTWCRGRWSRGEHSAIPSGPPEPAQGVPGDEGAEVFTAAPRHDQLATVVGGTLTEQDPASRGTAG